MIKQFDDLLVKVRKPAQAAGGHTLDSLLACICICLTVMPADINMQYNHITPAGLQILLAAAVVDFVIALTDGQGFLR